MGDCITFPSPLAVSESQQISEFSTSDQEIQDNLGFDPVVFSTPSCHMNSTIAVLCDDYFSVCTGICHGETGAYPLVSKTSDPTYDMRRLTINNGTDFELARRSILGYGAYNYWDDGSVWNSLGSLNDAPQYFQLRGEISGSAGDKLTSISFSSFEATYTPLQQSTSPSSDRFFGLLSQRMGIAILAIVVLVLVSGVGILYRFKKASPALKAPTAAHTPPPAKASIALPVDSGENKNA